MLILDNLCIVKYMQLQQVFGSKRLKMFKHIVEIPEGMYNMEASIYRVCIFPYASFIVYWQAKEN